MKAGWVAVSLLCTTLSPAVRAFELEMAPVTLNDTFSVPGWTTVTFLEPFDTRPLVFVLPTNQGSDPATIRLRNVTTTGFEVLQVEPSGNDGPHVSMTTAYLAIEPGNHVLPDGTRIIALERTTATFANRLLGVSWDLVPFPTTFAAAPAAIAQFQTMASESQTPPNTPSLPFMDVGMQNLGPASVQITLERAESTAGTIVAERVGIIAASGAFRANFDVDLDVAKAVTTTWDPVNGASGPYSIPDATVEYRIAIENRGSRSPDTGSLTVTGDVPADLSLCVTTTCLAGAPVTLDVSNSPVPPGITLGLVEYSDNNGATFGYVPVPDTSGYDANINAIRVTLDGVFGSISTSGAPSFELILGAKIQ